MPSNWSAVFTLALAALVTGTTGFTSPLILPLSADAKACPAPMEGFELSQVCKGHFFSGHSADKQTRRKNATFTYFFELLFWIFCLKITQ